MESIRKNRKKVKPSSNQLSKDVHPTRKIPRRKEKKNQPKTPLQTNTGEENQVKHVKETAKYCHFR